MSAPLQYIALAVFWLAMVWWLAGPFLHAIAAEALTAATAPPSVCAGMRHDECTVLLMETQP